MPLRLTRLPKRYRKLLCDGSDMLPFIIGDIMKREWIYAAGIRAVKTVCQTAIATIGTSAVMSEVNWQMVLSASVLAGILSILTSLAGLPEVKNE